MLHTWLVGRRHAKACAAAGVDAGWVGLARQSSPLFCALYVAVQAAVRQGRSEDIEDSMYDLATGATRDVRKTVAPRKGGEPGETDIITQDNGAVYDVKAAALLLPAYRPAEFAPRSGSASGGVSISITVAVPQPSASARPAAVVDAEIVEPASPTPPTPPATLADDVSV